VKSAGSIIGGRPRRQPTTVAALIAIPPAGTVISSTIAAATPPMIDPADFTWEALRRGIQVFAQGFLIATTLSFFAGLAFAAVERRRVVKLP
jgi:hypothetical protein